MTIAIVTSLYEAIDFFSGSRNNSEHLCKILSVNVQNYFPLKIGQLHQNIDDFLQLS